jgi:hemolysin activation/secretion protein
VPVSLCIAPNVPITNAAANPQGALVRGELRAEVRPVPLVTVAVEARGQYSASQLLSYEQFTLGSYTIGRGYDPGVLQGDSGLGGSLELRWGKLMPRGPEAFAIQPYAFVEAGETWSNNPLVPRRTLASAGGGARLRWGDHGDLDLAVAVPLQTLPGQASRGPARLLATFSTRFVPWTSQ